MTQIDEATEIRRALGFQTIANLGATEVVPTETGATLSLRKLNKLDANFIEISRRDDGNYMVAFSKRSKKFANPNEYHEFPRGAKYTVQADELVNVLLEALG